MRTKTALLTVAAFAAGIAGASAQVYSQNIVGYVNVVLKGQGLYTLVANPLDDGNGNQLTNLLATLPAKSTAQIWNGSGYVGATKGATWNANFALPPGTGFFVKNGIAASPDLTNTFVGNVLLPSGSSITNSIPAGYSLVGSPLPYAGDVTTDSNINVSILPAKSTIQRWDVATQGYQGTTKGASWTTSLNVGVGEGFFVNAKSATNWVQTLP